MNIRRKMKSLTLWFFSFCVAIVYEMLYKKVYKLPDIEYSVETMLHNDIKHEPSSHEYESGDAYATHIVFQDGRKFQLDRPGILRVCQHRFLFE